MENKCDNAYSIVTSYLLSLYIASKMTIAIVVTYNPEIGLLKKQYEALLGQVDGFVYVDNNSQLLNFRSEIKGEKVDIIQNEDNLGLAKAQNQGIKLARENGADYVILFDQDSVPTLDFVTGVMKCYEEQSKLYKVGLVGPAIRNLLRSCNENELGVILKGMFIKRIPIENTTEVSYCIASGSLIPMSVFEDVGGMEEKLFIDGLDLEWCLRARSKGYKIYQTSNTYLEHCLGDGTSRRIKSHSPIREYYIMRNAIWMIKQDYIPMGYRLRKLCLSTGRLMLSIFAFNVKYIKSDLKGIKDGLKL